MKQIGKRILAATLIFAVTLGFIGVIPVYADFEVEVPEYAVLSEEEADFGTDVFGGIDPEVTCFDGEAVFPGETDHVSDVTITLDENGRPYVEGELLVSFRSAISEKRAEEILLEEEVTESVEVIDDLATKTTALVEISEGTTVEEAIEQVEQDSLVAYAEPNYIYKLVDEGKREDTIEELSEESPGDDPEESPEENLLSNPLWHLDAIGAYDAWNLLDRTIHNKVRVAVLDSGVLLSHEDLQVNLNKELCVDVTGDELSSDISDSVGHGTHVAGIIGATGGNGIGIDGAASGLSNDLLDLFAVDIACDGDNVKASDIVKGLKYASEMGAQVINLSLSLSGSSNLLKTNIKKAYEQGIVIVCAAGNDASDGLYVPADFDTTIAVMNTRPDKLRNETSNYGTSKDLCAPGTDIISTWNDGTYMTLSGTSMAAPLVTSAAAMLLSADPDLTPEEVRNLLCTTAEDIYAEGFDADSGYGILNAANALKALLPELVSEDEEEPAEEEPIEEEPAEEKPVEEEPEQNLPEKEDLILEKEEPLDQKELTIPEEKGGKPIWSEKDAPTFDTSDPAFRKTEPAPKSGTDSRKMANPVPTGDQGTNLWCLLMLTAALIFTMLLIRKERRHLKPQNERNSSL